MSADLMPLTADILSDAERQVLRKSIAEDGDGELVTVHARVIRCLLNAAEKLAHIHANAEAAIAFCPTCAQGVTALPAMTHDELIFGCGKIAGRSAAERDAAESAAAKDAEIATMRQRAERAEADARRWLWAKSVAPDTLAGIAYRVPAACSHSDPDAATDAAIAASQPAAEGEG